jgi:hypothetical protein
LMGLLVRFRYGDANKENEMRGRYYEREKVKCIYLNIAKYVIHK